MGVEDLQGETLLNTVIGAVVVIVTGFIPVLNIISPVVGGGVAGYLQTEGMGGGAKLGVTVTIAFLIPLALLFVVASGLVASALPIGAAAVGSMGLLIVVILAIPSLILAVLGGAVAGAIAGEGQSSGEGAPT